MSQWPKIFHTKESISKTSILTVSPFQLICGPLTWEEQKLTCKFTGYLMQNCLFAKCFEGSKTNLFRGLIKNILTKIFSALPQPYCLSHTQFWKKSGHKIRIGAINSLISCCKCAVEDFTRHQISITVMW